VVIQIKLLEWDRDTYAGLTEAKTPIGIYRAYADGTLALGAVQLSYVKGRDWRDTEAVAQADFETRILSSINPTSATDLGEVTEALKPCPFCGAEPEHNMYFAWCTGPENTPHGPVNLGLENWNRRYPPTRREREKS